MTNSTSIHLETPEDTFRVSYYIPKLKKWHTHEDCNFHVMEIIGKLAVSLNRHLRVMSNQTHVIVDVRNGTEFAFLLNLFSNRLSGRCGQSTENRPNRDCGQSAAKSFGSETKS